MPRAFLYYSLTLAFFYLITSLENGKATEGVKWKIETVIVEGDTLYQFGSAQYTIDCYNKLMSGWEKSEDDKNYISKCIGLTRYGFNSARLVFRYDHFDQTNIDPCWDHIRFARVENGNYYVTNDTIDLYDEHNTLLMRLIYDKGSDRLRYDNEEWNYHIVYSRMNDE